MMQIKVTAPAQIHTTIQLPSSKSISNRALIINALGNRIFQLENLSDCDDTQVMIHALNDGKNTIDIMAGEYHHKRAGGRYMHRTIVNLA